MVAAINLFEDLNSFFPIICIIRLIIITRNIYFGQTTVIIQISNEKRRYKKTTFLAVCLVRSNHVRVLQSSRGTEPVPLS